MMARNSSHGDEEYTQLDSNGVQVDPEKTLAESNQAGLVVPLVVPSSAIVKPSYSRPVRLIAISPELSDSGVEMLKIIENGLLSLSESDVHHLRTYFEALQYMTEADRALAYSLARRALGRPVFAIEGEVGQ